MDKIDGSPLLHFYKDIAPAKSILLSKLFTYLKANVFWPIERTHTEEGEEEEEEEEKFQSWRDSKNDFDGYGKRVRKNATANRRTWCTIPGPNTNIIEAPPTPPKSRHYRTVLNPDK